MSLITDIDQQLATAMREGVASRTAVLRLVKSSIKNEQIKLGHELSDDEARKVVTREAKQRHDSIAAYNQADRPELAAAEEAELAIIQEFLPAQMADDELSALVDAVISETGSSGLSQMGIVIGAVMKKAGGAADGAAVSRLVKEKLVG